MGENELIYVAGNPDAYPLEYYDPGTKTYKGVIPKLLSEFAEQSSYEVVYYQADGKDHRDQFAKNIQVDLLSGYIPGDEIPENIGNVFLFQAQYEGETYTHSLYFTKTAPESFQRELRDYLSGVSVEELTGILMESSRTPQNEHKVHWIVGSLTFAVVTLVIAMICIVRHYRKKIRDAQMIIELDQTTGLGNSEYLYRYYKQYVTDRNRVLYQVVYFYTDTDRLRRISNNDETETYLNYCAKIFKEHTGENDILSRVSDDSFVILKFFADSSEIEGWVQTVLDQINEYTQVFEKAFETEIYAGIYAMRQQDKDLDEMMIQASQSARQAQHEGKKYLVCTQEMQEKLVRDRHLQASISQAFANHEFELYIQFYVDAQSLQYVGGEALSRWNHPQRGLLLPGEFIPMMERENLIGQLDYECLREVCRFLDCLTKEGIRAFFMSCNFSRETFSDPNFANTVKVIMEDYDFPREMLIMEITESASVKNTAQIKKNMEFIKAQGIRIALDDFGQGVTSFHDLQKYSIDIIKLDKELIDNLLTEKGEAIVKAIIQAGHDLHIQVLAEGIETDEQVECLQNIHCDILQGYRFFYPVPQWEALKRIQLGRTLS